MIWIPVALAIAVAMFYAGKAGLLIWALGETLGNWRYSTTSLVPGDPAMVTEIDHEDLQRHTDELQQLGFTPLGDLIITTDLRTRPERPISVESRTRGVGRIMVHPVHGCYANLTSVFSVSTPTDGITSPSSSLTPFRIVIATLAGMEDADWTYSTTNRQTLALNVLYRHPRRLARSLVKAGAGELLETHLKERDEIARRARISWDLEPDFTKYQAYEATAMKHLVKVNDAAQPSKVAWLMMTFPLKKHDVWMGDLRAF